LENSLTYKDAGVNLNAARELVNDIARLRRRTEGNRKLYEAFGGFASAFDLSGYREPVILTTCDGVGTKIQPLLKYDLVETAGIDLVAMNVNDILTSGAHPILFLDYIGIGRMDRELIGRLITGMTTALESCHCILAGGETAEMPDLVEPGLVELSGFCVGAAEKSALCQASGVRVGDAVIGLPSNGFHSNGWSLIRKIFQRYPAEFDENIQRKLLAPTRIYFDEVEQLNKANIPIKSMAHITGGGIPENLERALGGKGASLKLPPWEDDAVRRVLSHVEPEEALSAFNMGIGWIMVFDPAEADRALACLPHAMRLGEVAEGTIKAEMLK